MRERVIKKKKGILLVGIFIVLVGIAYILRNPEVLPIAKKTEALFPGFAKEKINKVKIEKGQLFSNVLVKKDGSWVVENEGGFPADENLVESVLATVSKLQKEELVGKSKANHGKFGVDWGNKGDRGNLGDQGIRTTFIGEGKKYELIVGGRGPGFSSTYFRRGDETEVYLANQDLDLVFGEDDYRDLGLGLKAQSSRLKAISIENSSGVYELEKKDDKWRLTKPEEKDDIVQSRVEDLVSRLTTLEAADATTSAELSETGFENPTVTVKIVGEDGEDELVVGNEKDSQRYAQISGSPYIYLLAPSDYGTLEEIDEAYFVEEDSVEN